MVQVNVLDADHQITVAAVGTPLDRIPRANSLCTHVVSGGQMKTLDGISAIPATAAHIKAYVGVPLTGREGLVIGTLCLLDTVPRHFSPDALEDLNAAAAVIQDELELIRRLDQVNFASTAEAATLINAVHQDQVIPYYQTIIDLHTGEIQAVEALARWHHPEEGLLTPDVFVPLAEDSEIIIDLDLAILRHASHQLRQWQPHHPDLRLNVNLSARHFDHPDCISRLQSTVVEAGIEPGSVSFELTETAALPVHPHDRNFLRDLRETGFRVLLDDFGTGFASIDQVLRLPIDGIKLSRSLSAAMNTSTGNTVVRHLIALSHDLQLTAVIEGIENREGASWARGVRADAGQGYLWTRPLAADEMTTHMADFVPDLQPGLRRHE